MWALMDMILDFFSPNERKVIPLRNDSLPDFGRPTRRMRRPDMLTVDPVLTLLVLVNFYE